MNHGKRLAECSFGLAFSKISFPRSVYDLNYPISLSFTANARHRDEVFLKYCGGTAVPGCNCLVVVVNGERSLAEACGE